MQLSGAFLGRMSGCILALDEPPCVSSLFFFESPHEYIIGLLVDGALACA